VFERSDMDLIHDEALGTSYGGTRLDWRHFVAVKRCFGCRMSTILNGDVDSARESYARI